MLVFLSYMGFLRAAAHDIEESRVFVQTLNFAGVAVNSWMKDHVSSVKFLGDFLTQTVGTPTTGSRSKPPEFPRKYSLA